jgi:hypothetical protein
MFQGHVHEVRLMPPEEVQPYWKAQKTAGRDAEAITEASLSAFPMVDRGGSFPP